MTTANGALDTFVYANMSTGAGANTAWGGFTSLLVGSDGTNLSRSLVRFNLSALPTGANVQVMDSKLYGYNYFTGSGTNPHALDGVGLRPGRRLHRRHRLDPPTRRFGCGDAGLLRPQRPRGQHLRPPAPADQRHLAGPALAARRRRQQRHHACRRPTSTPPTPTRSCTRASRAGAPSPCSTINFNRPPAMATASRPGRRGPHHDHHPHPDRQRRHRPRRRPGDVLVPGHGQRRRRDRPHAIESGWQAGTSFTVPAGNLVDGLTYSWHVYTWDFDRRPPSPLPTWERTFTVDLHLGAEPAAPYDAIGPAQVNLVSGNAGGRRRLACGAELRLQLLHPVGHGRGHRQLLQRRQQQRPLDDPVVMERRDPTIGFAWGAGGPGGGVWADNFLVRWTASVTVPVAGSYKFFASSDDGMRIWVTKGGGSRGPGARPLGPAADCRAPTPPR